MNTDRFASRIRISRARWLRAWWIIVGLGLWICFPADRAVAQSGWELDPYRIHVAVSWTASPQLPPRIQEELLRGLIERTDALIGASWNVVAAPTPRDLQPTIHTIAADAALHTMPREETDDHKLQALAAFVAQLTPSDALTVPPNSVEAIKEGKRLFLSAETGCTRCHRLPLGTDSGMIGKDGLFLRHDVGTGDAASNNSPRLLETPSLFGLRGAKTFLRHQQIKKLEEVLTKFNPDDRHGRTSHLNQKQIHALAEYLRYFQTPSFDKLMLLSVTADSDGFRVVARELDLRTELFSAPIPRRAWQSGKLLDVAMDSIVEAFAPLARIEAHEKNRVSLRLRAAALPPRDRSLDVAAGDVFRPVLRFNDRDGNIRRVNPIEWTFFTVEDATRQPMKCPMLSGFRRPLSGRRRGRVEWLALGVVSPNRPSTLVLHSQSKDKLPLAGYNVYAHPPDSKRTLLIGVTDREGRLSIPPAENPLRVLLVRNGTETLARLPIVPGLQPSVVAPIANDEQRLEAEGFVTGIQQELVDMVTRREVLLTLARRRIDEGKLDDAEKLIGEMGSPGRADDYLFRLNSREKELRTDDPSRAAKIKRLFSDTRTLVNQHCDRAPITEITDDLDRARDEAVKSSS